MKKKYELTTNTKAVNGKILYQIRALKDFCDIKAGDLGGYIESEDNLSHNGDCWVYGNARVSGDADYVCFKGFGSCNRNTTMFRTKNGDIYVRCGCFIGNLKEFEEKVKETHGDSKYAKEYLACVEVAKIHFEMRIDYRHELD